MERADRGALCTRPTCPYTTPCSGASMEYVLRVAPVGVTVTCLGDGKVVWTNGVAPVPDGVLERDLLDMLDADDQPSLNDAIVATASSAEPQRLTARTQHGQIVELTVTHAATSEHQQAITFWKPAPVAADGPTTDPQVMRDAMAAIAREVVRAGFVEPGLGGLARLPGVETLNDRELKILALLARGMPSREIGVELYVSGSTIRNHLTAIYRKLGVANHAELMHLLPPVASPEQSD